MNILNRNFLRHASLVGAALLVAACGGGGGDDSGSSAVVVPTAARSGTASASSDLTLANAGSFAGVLARTVMSSADGSVPVLASSRESPQARLSAASGSRLRQAVRAAARSAVGGGREVAQGISRDTVLCDLSGSFSVEVNDADDNQRLSRGDTASFVFTNCAFDVVTPAVNGNLSFVVNAVELDSQQLPTALDATVTLTGFAEAGFGTLSGTFRIWFREEAGSNVRQRISYTDAAMNSFGQDLAYNFDIYGVAGTTSATFDLNGALTVAGTTYAMVTTTPFSQNGVALPDAGVVELRDAAGDRVILRALDGGTNFDLEFQAAGAATPTVVQANLFWSFYRLNAN